MLDEEYKSNELKLIKASEETIPLLSSTDSLTIPSFAAHVVGTIDNNEFVNVDSAGLINNVLDDDPASLLGTRLPGIFISEEAKSTDAFILSEIELFLVEVMELCADSWSSNLALLLFVADDVTLEDFQ